MDSVISARISELLRKKRDGGQLTKEDLRWFCEQVVQGNVVDCQIGAMLMAMYIRGMSDSETLGLTQSYVETGEILSWNAEWASSIVDKHSTGGIGDKVSIVLAPALASLGLKVPMLSGRGLGHTGGTLDKLESIPGFVVTCSKEMLENALETAGCFIAGASKNIAPADRILYSIRDVTETTDSIPLVVASIVSKKVASGSKVLIMDMKVGKAAFFTTVEDARKLATEIIKVSSAFGITTRAVITKMDVPIGKGIGNALEIEDAIECMKGNGTPDIVELVTVQGALILLGKNMVSNMEEGRKLMLKSLENGEALKAFEAMIRCQGVEPQNAAALCDGYFSKVLPSVPQSQIVPLRVKTPGTITSIDAMKLGKAVWMLGAGRSDPQKSIDYRVGVWLTHRVGDVVDVGDVWAEVHCASDEDQASAILDSLNESIEIKPGKHDIEHSLIVEII